MGIGAGQADLPFTTENTQNTPQVVFPTFAVVAGSGTASPGAVYNGTITITIAPFSESYASTLRQVTVTLNWISGKITRTRSMSTLVSQNGILTYKH